MATAEKKVTSRRTTAKPTTKKAEEKAKVKAVVAQTTEEAEKKRSVYYRNIKDKSVVAKVIKRPNKSTVILQSADNAVTISVSTLEKMWEPFDPEAEQVEKIEAKKKKERAKENKQTATVEWANIESLTGAVKKLVVDMTYKTKHSDRDILCYSGKHNVISFYVAKDRVRVLFKESEEIRNELKDYEIVKGTAQPSVLLNYGTHTQEDLQRVVDTILKITTAEKKAVKKTND